MKSRRAAVLLAICLLHVGFFHALQAGLVREVSRVMEHPLIARLVPPPPVLPVVSPQPPEPLKAVRQRPKPAELKPPPPLPIAPPVAIAPAPTAITIETKPPPTEPPPVQVVVAPTPPTPAPTPAPPPVPFVEAAPPAPPRAPPRPPAPIPVIATGVEYLRAPEPNYPVMSRRLGEQGRVVLRVLINTSGQPEKVEIGHSSGSTRLDAAARDAALRALFKPHREDGRPIAVWALVPIVFQLDS